MLLDEALETHPADAGELHFGVEGGRVRVGDGVDGEGEGVEEAAALRIWREKSVSN